MHSRIRYTALLLCLTVGQFLASEAAWSEEKRGYTTDLNSDKALLATIMDVRLHLTDQVTDGCWPRPAAVKNTVELVLRRNGFEVAEGASFPQGGLYIAALGGTSGASGCIVSVNLIYTRLLFPYLPFGADNELAVVEYHVYERSGLVFGPKSHMQKRIRDMFEEWTEGFAIDVQRARDEIFKLRPDIKKSFEKFLEDTSASKEK